jgi:hypothetical protein
MMRAAASPDYRRGIARLMTLSEEPHRPQSDHEFRAERLGYALRRLAADLVEARRDAMQLRRENDELRSELERHRARPRE